MNKMNEYDFNLDEMLEDYVEDIRNRENWDISFEEYKKKTIESYSLQKHNKLKWVLKDELEMLSTNELYKVEKLMISFHDKEKQRKVAKK